MGWALLVVQVIGVENRCRGDSGGVRGSHRSGAFQVVFVHVLGRMVLVAEVRGVVQVFDFFERICVL